MRQWLSNLWNKLRPAGESEARPNMERIMRGLYVVRTQAGFKKAVKEFSEYECGHHDLRVVGYPRNYPAFVALSVEYRGYSYVRCRAIHVKRLRAGLARH